MTQLEQVRFSIFRIVLFSQLCPLQKKKKKKKKKIDISINIWEVYKPLKKILSKATYFFQEKDTQIN